MITHPSTATPSVHVPETLHDALERVSNGAEVLAGGTWVMRGEVRGEGYAPEYVLTGRLPEMNRLELTEDQLIVGAGVTHDRLAAALKSDPRYAGLQAAARKSANPAIRRLATVGGNLSTAAFAAADLIPALIAVSAEVTIASPTGSRSMPVDEFLVNREHLLSGSVLTHVTIPGPPGATVHERLTLRKAGDYPIAIVHIHAATDAVGVVTHATVALGAVEDTPRSWDTVAAELVGKPLDATHAHAITQQHLDELSARNGTEAAGWYRLQVLPALVRNAVRTLQRRMESR